MRYASAFRALLTAVIVMAACFGVSANRDLDRWVRLLTDSVSPLPSRIDIIPYSSPDILPEGISSEEDISQGPYAGLTAVQRDSAYRADHYWWNLFRRRKLDMKDSTVIYPKFLGFCVKVYNWADHVFNSYNPDYVEGTGKRWKARLVSDNWVDSYAMNFHKRMSMRMMSDIYCNAGAYIQYMAVSLGYSLNLNHAVWGKPLDQKRFEFGFNCARFNADISYMENTGGSYMRKFGDYKGGRLFKLYFPGIEMHSLDIDLYYFFNNKKYSHGAAYNFSKYQKRSAGSFIIGLTYSDQNISMDFSTLPAALVPYLKIDSWFLKFHYFNYCLLFGYGYNWVLNRHWLFNISLMPSIGVNHCYEDSAEGTANLLSANFKGLMSLTYNHRNFFIGIIGKMNGHLYHSDKHTLFSSIENFSANFGFRF